MKTILQKGIIAKCHPSTPRADSGGYRGVGGYGFDSDNAGMREIEAAFTSESMRAEKRAVAGSSVLAAFAITTLKIVVGFTTGSLGILSEAAHSALDLIAAIITLLSVRVSDKPADADHQ